MKIVTIAFTISAKHRDDIGRILSGMVKELKESNVEIVFKYLEHYESTDNRERQLPGEIPEKP